MWLIPLIKSSNEKKSRVRIRRWNNNNYCHSQDAPWSLLTDAAYIYTHAHKDAKDARQLWETKRERERERWLEIVIRSNSNKLLIDCFREVSWLKMVISVHWGGNSSFLSAPSRVVWPVPFQDNRANGRFGYNLLLP